MANTGTAVAYAASAPKAFSDLYEQLKSKFVADAQLMTYNPQSESSIRAKLASALKPAYDRQIASRQRQTQQARAQVDADAAARGIGASTWVTDAKTRLGNNEASDVANLNSDYISTLASQLLNRLAGQEANRLSVEQYNAGQRQSAFDRAYNLALQQYERWGAPVASAAESENRSRGGGGGGSNPKLTMSELSQIASTASPDGALMRAVYDAATHGGLVSDYDASVHDYYIGKTVRDATGLSYAAQRDPKKYGKRQAAIGGARR